MTRLYNFSAGPAILPRSVLEKAAEGILNFNGLGLSLLELSHRGPEYAPVHEQAQADLLELMGLGSDEYAVLFLGGGASVQFAMIPMNFLTADRHAEYVHTGVWAGKAIREAKRFGEIDVVGSSEDQNFSELPRGMRFHEDASYVHFTSNNTIYGTQFRELPNTGKAPLICDMSSDFLSRELPFDRFDLIYAGAQKNLGPAGVAVVVIRRAFVASANRDIPTLFSYRTHMEANSLANTPPVFGIFMVGLVAQWIKQQGGVSSIESNNQRKAAVLYDALDDMADFYQAAVTRREDRSLMNVSFRLADPSLEAGFLEEARKAGMVGLKGHRLVGGCRASIYNAFPLEGVEALVSFMTAFANRHV